jgi:hypothetical protein
MAITCIIGAQVGHQGECGGGVIDIQREAQHKVSDEGQGDEDQQAFFHVKSRRARSSLIVPGLTAKVFRTYHATHTVRSYLEREGNVAKDAPNYQKEYVAKLANLEAAIVCNHKRTPPKNWAGRM